jgi:hypothetical protein
LLSLAVPSRETVHFFWKILLAYHGASAAPFYADTPLRWHADTVVIVGCRSAALCLYAHPHPPRRKRCGQVLAGGFSIFRFFCGDFALHLVLIILKIHTL